MTSKETIAALASSLDSGLSSPEAEARLAKFGKNRLEISKKITIWHRLFSQFKELMIIILIIAGVIAVIANETFDASIIFFIVFVNALIGVIQEYRAEKAVDALKKIMSLQATVMRDGIERIIDADNLVPGDIIILEEGSKIPADARILESAMLKVDEAILTGESVPRNKSENAIKETEIALVDNDNILFAGTVISSGRCKAIVLETGMKTEFGRIADLTSEIRDEKSPLQKEMAKAGKLIAKAVLLICVLVFVIGLLKGKEIFEMFLFTISLGVAAVPEGLPTTMTIALALGVQKMAKKKAIVRNLSSVDTLGSITVICTDKTGTLTKNEMTVKQIFVNNRHIDVGGEGYSPEGKFMLGSSEYTNKGLIGLLRTGMLCNNAYVRNESGRWTMIGDTTEGALVVSAEKAGLRHKETCEAYPRIYEIPFSSNRKMMITIHSSSCKSKRKDIVAYMKGATGVVVDKCSFIEIDGKIKKLSFSEKEKIKMTTRNMSEEAMRVLAFAYKKLKGKESKDFKYLKEEGFVFQGLQGMMDPPRAEIKDAVAKCRTAGVRIFVITGDHGLTARAIAKQVGLATGSTKIITGLELDKMSEDELTAALKEEVIFARVTAENKMRVVNSLMKKGEIVAVTGDGVNDAPAIKRANIGISMGITGTEVSKEASKMILADDSFATIVNAMEEGRTIFDNIKIFIKYLFMGNAVGILSIFFTMIVGLPLPFFAFHILWFNLLTETLPSIALTKEPPEHDIMSRKPRGKSESILTRKDFSEIIFNALIMTVGVLCVFYYGLVSKGWNAGDIISGGANPYYYVYATTLAFTTLVLYQLFNVFNIKSPRKTIFFEELLNNRWLLFATAISIMLQIAVVNTTFLNKVFSTAPLSLTDWAISVMIASSIIWISEGYKIVLRINEKRKTTAIRHSPSAAPK
ncbi:MAG: cation-translocating P-type ATPase [archaeon]